MSRDRRACGFHINQLFHKPTDLHRQTKCFPSSPPEHSTDNLEVSSDYITDFWSGVLLQPVTIDHINTQLSTIFSIQKNDVTFRSAYNRHTNITKTMNVIYYDYHTSYIHTTFDLHAPSAS